jgi:hypothetical protein
MSRKDALVLASRTLALLLAAWALADLCYLPGIVHSFRHYVNREPDSSTSIEYWRHHYLVSLGFLVTRIVGFSLLSRWLFKGGSEVEELLLPSESQESATWS